jgi:2,3-bisphosphoglycerate-independent phosphoglycerate mutase
MAKKCILILLDGVGDRSHPELKHRTPLQAARTPALDRLARIGANGLYHAARVGQALPSENAHFGMFGYDMDVFPGRGALEALGAGIDLAPETVAILTHLVSVRPSPEATLLLAENKPQTSAEEVHTLFQTVAEYNKEGIQVRLHPTHGIHGILTLNGDVAPFVTDSDPIAVGRALTAVTPWQAYSADASSRKTARIICAYLNWAHHVLSRHPLNQARGKAGRPQLNALVTQRAGRLQKALGFTQQYGLRGLSIASGIMYHGLGTYLGMDVCRVADSADPAASGEDLSKRIRMALASLSDYDFIHVHTKTPDEAGHTKDPLCKKRVLEALDRGIGDVLPELLDEPDLLVVVAADHSTPSAGPLIHSGESVPLIFCGPGVRRDRVQHYDEVSAAQGALSLIRGKELIYLVLNHLDLAKLQGLMDTPVNQAYWPGRSTPLRLSAPAQGADAHPQSRHGRP